MKKLLLAILLTFTVVSADTVSTKLTTHCIEGYKYIIVVSSTGSISVTQMLVPSFYNPTPVECKIPTRED